MRSLLEPKFRFLGVTLISFLFQTVVESGKQYTFQSNKFGWDNCQVIASKKVLSYDEAVNCYKSFPFKETIRTSTIETIRRTLPFYAFIDISKHSPEPKIPIRQDLYAGLDEIRDKHYDTELEFQDDTTSLFRKLHDGHTGYRSSCYTTFIFRQPFPVITVRASFNQQKFLVLDPVQHPPELENEWNKLGLNISRYFGAEILLIDSVSPLVYLENYADNYIGSSRDPNSRFNLALARAVQRDGKWGVAFGSFASTTVVPPKKEVTYTFRLSGGRVETVTAPYLASNPGNFQDKNEFYTKFCAQDDDTRLNSKAKFESKDKQLQIPQIPEIAKITIDAPLPQIKPFEQDPLKNPLTKGEVIQTWVTDNNTGVMTITTFSARSQSQFLKEASQGFSALRKKGVDTLILDLSNNGGGVICWGYYILDYLFPPKSSQPPHRFNTDMHKSTLLKALAKRDDQASGFFNYKYWDTPTGGSFNSTKEFVSGHAYRRGGTVGHYTSEFRDSCGVGPLRTPEYMSEEELSNQEPPWPASRVVFVTNSVCYSTCSLLANSLQEIHGITTYALGGIRGREATVASIQGGTVYNLDAFLEDLEESALSDHPEAPRPFLTKSSFSFTIREAYSTQSPSLSPTKHHKKFGPRPLEFTWHPATYHMPYPGPVTYLDPYQQWRQIADDFHH